MELFGVYLGISNGVENWLVHGMIDGTESIFTESSAALMTKAQADRVAEHAKSLPYFADFVDTMEIIPLLTIET